jgi:hypothetical protein
MNTHLSESLDGVEVVKGAAQENEEVDRFVMNARRVRDAFVRQGDLEGRYVAMLLLGSAMPLAVPGLLLFQRRADAAVVAYLAAPSPSSHLRLYLCILPDLTGHLQCPPHFGPHQSRPTSTRTLGYADAMRGEVEFRV